MRRGLPLLALAAGIALGVPAVAQVPAPPRLELSAAPAWKGWTRPGRTTGLEVVVSADRAKPVTVGLESGPLLLRATAGPEPGRPARLHLPLAVGDAMALTLAAPGFPSERRPVTLLPSEAPLLAVALAEGGTLSLENFHAVAVGPADLPRLASGYGAIDALVIDGPTLAALDARQLDALSAHVGACGRVAVAGVAAEVRDTLAASAGCGGRLLHLAATPATARDALRDALARGETAAPVPFPARDEARTGEDTWRRVALALGAAFVAVALVAAVVAGPFATVAASAIAAAALALALPLLAVDPRTVTKEADDATSAVRRFVAASQSTGAARGTVRMDLPPAMAAARPCEARQPMTIDFDAQAGRAVAAEAGTRLFHAVAACAEGVRKRS